MHTMSPESAPAAVSQPGARTRRLSHRGAVVAAVLALLGFVLICTAVAGRPGGVLVGTTTASFRTDQVVVLTEDGDAVVQPVRASDDDLAAVEVTFGTYAGSARCTVEVSLREPDDDPVRATGAEIASEQLSCADLPDSTRVQVLRFEPVEDSQGQVYDVTVERTGGVEGSSIALWAGTPDDESIEAVVNGQVDTLSIAARPLYDPEPRWWDQWDRIADRMAAYGPAWANGPGFLTLLALVGACVTGIAAVHRRPRLLLGLVVLLALARGLLWGAALPTFAGMDEPAHFANVEFLATEGALPGTPGLTDAYSPRTGIAQGELNTAATTPGDRADYSAEGERRSEATIDAAPNGGGGAGAAATYPPAYYALATPFYLVAADDFFAATTAVRFFSVLLGVAAAALLTLIGRKLFPESAVAQAGFAVAGVLHPMLGHQFAIINNDAWVILWGFVALLTALVLAERGRAPWWALFAGVVIGMTLLGKPFGIAVALPLAVGWLVGKIRFRVRSPRALLTEMGLVALGALLTYGTWRLVAVLAHIPVDRAAAGDGGMRSRRAFLDAMIGSGGATAKMIWADQLWGNFGWVRIPFAEPIPTVIFRSLLVLAVVAVIWVVVASVVAVRRAHRRRVAVSGAEVNSPDTSVVTSPVPGAAETTTRALPVDVRVLITVVMIVSTGMTIYGAAWTYYAWTGNFDLIQGRYALLAMPAILALPGLLLMSFTRRPRLVATVNVVLAVAMAALMVTGLRNVLENFYG